VTEVSEMPDMTAEQRAELQKKIILSKMQTVKLHDHDLKIILISL